MAGETGSLSTGQADWAQAAEDNPLLEPAPATGGLPLGPVVTFGFSWLVALWLRRARSQAVDRLGFPWILSSESRLFNGLRGTEPSEYYRPPYRGDGGAGSAPHGLGRRPGWIVHVASLTEVLIFRKELSSAPFPFGRLKPKAKRSQRHGRKSQ
jgi:hypothetical protein